MKQCLLLLMLVMLNFGITQAQNQGHSWTFGAAAPFVSVPAIAGSPGTHTLTVLDFGENAITVQNEVVGPLGTSCAAAINVGEYGAPPDYFLFGLVFDNPGAFVSNVYTIEMAVKFQTNGNFHRLIGFTDLLVPGTPGSTSDDGIYIAPDAPVDNGQVVFRIGGVDNYFGSPTIDPDTWYYLTFVREADNNIKFYVDGVYQSAFDDAGLDFLPKVANGNDIIFFKDEGSEEKGGSIAKLSIYNRALTEAEIQRRTFNNVCNTSLLLSPNPNEGHQWTFTGAAPFPSTPAVAGSVGPFDLFNIGAAITTGTTENPATGASCTAAVPIGEYPLASGLEFQNTPRYVYDTYSIEMTVNIANLGGLPVRLVGFTDLGTLPASNYGIYVNTAGHVDFVNAGGSNPIAAAPLTVNTWYHLVFTRNSAGLISYYQNGALIGTYDDSAGDDFIPQGPNGNVITLLKDDDADESNGKIAKVGIFNAVLALTDVQERFNNICNANLVILPISLKSFTAVKVDKEVQLTWVTATEENNLGFEVQRSKDGINYTTIGFVKGSGTSTQENTYRFTDPSPLAGNNYYRLKQIDITNLATFSTIRRINMDKIKQDIHLFPNPARGTITITNIKAGDQLSIFNIQGNLVARKTASSGQESVSVEKFASGVYMLQVTDKENSNRIIRFTKF